MDTPATGEDLPIASVRRRAARYIPRASSGPGASAPGHPCAALLRAGLVVDVWDRTPAAAARLAAAGAAAHDRPGQAVAHADVVITMLADEAAVLSVAIDQDMLDMLQQGAVWAQMATIGVQATERLAQIVADARPDVRFVDAPVSGTRQPAEAAQRPPW